MAKLLSFFSILSTSGNNSTLFYMVKSIYFRLRVSQRVQFPPLKTKNAFPGQMIFLTKIALSGNGPIFYLFQQIKQLFIRCQAKIKTRSYRCKKPCQEYP